MKSLIREYKKIKGDIFFGYLKIARIFRILTNQSIYHVVGDSHTTSFLHPAFIIHHIGPSTAYKLNFEKSTTKGREKVIKILNKIYKKKIIKVIFVFGEIDTRIHINKVSKEKKISINKLVDLTVESYFNFLKFIKYKYPLIEIHVLNIMPQGEEENIYNYPFYASRKERISISEKMNNKIRTNAKKEGFKFIDIYKKLINRSGDRKKEYVFDKVHFNRKITRFVLYKLK